MASESVPAGIPKNVTGGMPSDATLRGLESNHWVCDFEAHRALWEAQSILRLAGEALEDGYDREVVQLAIHGAERLLVGQIRRTGWEGIGPAWGQASQDPKTPAD